MHKPKFLIAFAIFTFLNTASARDKKYTMDELLAAHLQSIGSPEALKQIHSRVLSGTASVRFIQGATGAWDDGQFSFGSELYRIGIMIKFGALEYPGEHFAYDSQEVTVGHIAPGQRSPLADFIFRFDGIVKEGLLGGTLSVAWPLLNMKERKPELKHKEGKLNGRPVYEVEYRPGKLAGGMKIKLLFAKETFRHLRTEYRVAQTADMTATRSVNRSTPASPGRSQTGTRPIIFDPLPDSSYLLVEKFENFRKIGDLTLPYTYTIDYSIEGQGSSLIASWNMQADGQFTNNGQIAPGFFKAQK